MRRTSITIVGIALAFTAPLASLANAENLPLVAQSRDGPCRMTVRGGGKYFAIEVTGLAPSEELDVTSASEGEVVNHSANAGANGGYVAIDVPLVQGKSSGTGTFTVKGEHCTIQASYPWHE